jgi:hypothetical protein
VGTATIRQAADDPAILAALSLPERPYPVTATEAQSVGVLVVADPWNLAHRMIVLDNDLAPQHGIRFSADVSRVVDAACAAVPAGDRSSRGLWAFPWTTVARRHMAMKALADDIGPLNMPIPGMDGGASGGLARPLFAGRVREFRGDVEGATGAKAAYMAARPSRRTMAAAVASLPEPQATAITNQLLRVKEDATYWLGVLMLAEKHYAAAQDYLGRMMLDESPDSRWTDAARINLAEALVGLERTQEAVVFLREDGSPQRFGSRLLAKKLLERVGSNPARDDEGAVEPAGGRLSPKIQVGTLKDSVR